MEDSYRSLKVIFEDFYGYFQRIDCAQVFENDPGLLYQAGEIYLTYGKSSEALVCFQESIDIAISKMDQKVLPLDSYVKLMTKRRLFHECTLQLTKLSLLNSSYNYYRAWAFLEAKNYSTSEKILKTCSKSTKVNLLLARLYYELKDWKNMFTPLDDVIKKEECKKSKWEGEDKSIEDYLTALDWIGKEKFAQKDYKEAIEPWLTLTFVVMIFLLKDRAYEVKNIVPRLNALIPLIEEMERSDPKLLLEVRENVVDSVGHFQKMIQYGFHYLKDEDKPLKAIICTTWTKIAATVIFSKQDQQRFITMQHLIIFEAHAIMENRDDAISELQSFMNRSRSQMIDDPYFLELVKKAFGYYAALKYYPEGTDAYETLIKIPEVRAEKINVAMFSFTQARILFQDQQHVESIALFDECAKVKYEQGEVFLWRPALSYIHLKDYKKALKWIVTFLSKRNSFGQFEFTMTILAQGYCFTKLKMYDQAERSFKKAVKTKLKGGDLVSYVPLYRMIAALDKKDGKEVLKYLKLMMQQQNIKFADHLVSFLQDAISDEGRYLKNEWRKILDTVTSNSRALLPNPEREVQQCKTYRNSSLIVLTFLNKKYDS